MNASATSLSLDFEFDAADAMAVGPRAKRVNDGTQRRSKRQLAADPSVVSAARNLAGSAILSATVQDAAIAPASQIAPTAALTSEKVRSRRGDFLYLDIETVPDYSRLESFGLPPVPLARIEGDIDECPAPEDLLKNSVRNFADDMRNEWPCDDYLNLLIAAERNGKNRDGIMKEIESFRREKQRIREAADERRKLLSTTPEYLRIVAIGWAVGSGPVQSMVNAEAADGLRQQHESEMLQTLVSLIEADHQSPIVGFGVLGFDLPAILTRCILLGIPVGRLIDRRPWGRDVIDLCSARYDKAWGRPLGLKPLARCLGIPVPAGDVDGSQVEALLANDPAEVGEYVRSDVEITRELHRMYVGYFCL